MSAPYNRQFRQSWRLSLLLSLLLHAGVVIPVFLRCSAGDAGAGQGLLIDTRVVVLDHDVNLKLDDEPIRQAQSAPKSKPDLPISVPATKAILPSSASQDHVSPVVLRPFVAQREPAQGISEQQEEPSSRKNGTGLGKTGIGNGAGGTTTSFFGIATEGRKIVYVIDRSASMGLNGSFEAAKRELLRSLASLPVSARFQIIAYNRDAEPLLIGGKAELVEATPENKASAADRLNECYAEGGTDHMRALKRALQLLPDTIFLLTDADDLRADQVRDLTVRNHDQSAVHAIELSNGRARRGDQALHALAEQNRGIYRRVSVSR